MYSASCIDIGGDLRQFFRSRRRFLAVISDLEGKRQPETNQVTIMPQAGRHNILAGLPLIGDQSKNVARAIAETPLRGFLQHGPNRVRIFELDNVHPGL